jgi:hypothetical protein
MSVLNFSQANDYLSRSVSELIAHRNSVGNGREGDLMEVRTAKINGTTVVQIWWTNVPSSVMTKFMWDGVSIDGHDETRVTELVASLIAMGCVPSKEPLSHRWPEQVPHVPMYDFHPQRFRALIPLAKTAAQVAQSGMPAFSIESMRTVGNHLVPADRERIAITPLRLRIQAPPRSREKVLDTCMFYGDWVQHGRHIFDFPSALAEAFRRTDVDDIPLSAVHFPYDSFYLHFGPQRDLETAPGWHPDGAYVSVIGDPNVKLVVNLCLTSIPADPSMALAWDAYPEPVYIQAISSELMGTGIAEAADRVLAEKMATLRKQAGSSDKTLEAAAADLKEAGLIPEDLKLKDASAHNASSELERLPNLHAAWKEMLRLVINGIAYLSGYGDDVSTDWPAKAPADLLKQQGEGTPKQRQRANSKLAALGYTPVHICGKRFAEQRESSSSHREGEKRPVWVRGSWVRQAYGPRHSLRRLQWRMPHQRNKDAEGEALGHLYLVS